MKQFIDDPNSLDEGSKAMVCEAVEVLQVSDYNIFSLFSGTFLSTAGALIIITV